LIFGKEKNMSLLELEKLNVIAIYVDNLAQAMEFYSKVFGFEKRCDLGPGILMDSGNTLSIYIEGGYKKTDPKENLTRTSFCISPKDGVKAAWQKISEAGIETLGEFEDHGEEFAMFYLVDPSGNIIEIAGKP
jgi:predicted enzyme related to lactoylglutathione lyase